MYFHSPEKVSAVGAFLEANHHNIITHLITLDKKTLKYIFICRLLINYVLSIQNTENVNFAAQISTNMKLIIDQIKEVYLLTTTYFYFCRKGQQHVWPASLTISEHTPQSRMQVIQFV